MRRPDERGVGTVLTAGACVALLTTAWAASVPVVWLAQVSSTQDAADLASLAGASAHAQSGDACGAAGEVAARNHSELMQCIVTGDEWSFVVEVHVSQVLEPSLPGAPTIIERRATAGSIQ